MLGGVRRWKKVKEVHASLGNDKWVSFETAFFHCLRHDRLTVLYHYQGTSPCETGYAFGTSSNYNTFYGTTSSGFISLSFFFVVVVTPFSCTC